MRQNRAYKSKSFIYNWVDPSASKKYKTNTNVQKQYGAHGVWVRGVIELNFYMCSLFFQSNTSHPTIEKKLTKFKLYVLKHNVMHDLVYTKRAMNTLAFNPKKREGKSMISNM